MKRRTAVILSCAGVQSKPLDLTHRVMRDHVVEHSDSHDISKVYAEAAKHLVAQQAQVVKTITAMELSAQVYRCAVEAAEATHENIEHRLNARKRNPEAQTWLESFAGSILQQYDAHIRAIAEVGVTAIARELYKDVIVELPIEPKRRLFW